MTYNIKEYFIHFRFNFFNIYLSPTQKILPIVGKLNTNEYNQRQRLLEQERRQLENNMMYQQELEESIVFEATKRKQEQIRQRKKINNEKPRYITPYIIPKKKPEGCFGKFCNIIGWKGGSRKIKRKRIKKKNKIKSKRYR